MKDITGTIYHHLTVVRPDGRANDGRVKWLCVCECGKFCNATKNNLENGNKKSCGCKTSEMLKTNLKHGMKNHKLYSTWHSMISRCHNEEDPSFKHYGGRGIEVCKRWREDINNFIEDMGERPSGLSIDRFDNFSGYNKENCRWANQKEQHENRRNTVRLSDGISINELSEKTGVKRQTLYMRKRRGWTDEEIRNGSRTAKK